MYSSTANLQLCSQHGNSHSGTCIRRYWGITNMYCDSHSRTCIHRYRDITNMYCDSHSHIYTHT